ncbi:MAG: hypothetical protein ACSLE9_13345 [Burkholderiaceae bacterium]
MTPRWPRPDFLSKPRGAPKLAWIWLATGALTLAATVAEGLAVQQRIDVQRAQLADATQRIAKASPPNAPLGSHSTAAGNQAAAVRAARSLSTLLGHPWGQILSSIEAETPTGLQWLLLEHASAGPDLRLEGLAPDIPAVLQLVDVLSARAGWSQVVLGRLQAADTRGDTAGGARWRFEIQAVVDARRIAAGRSDGEP